jgi:Ca2+-binding EF-hand superfamily protein
LGHNLTEEEEALALHRLDTNGDGSISYAEFAAWWREKDRFAKFNLTDGQQQAILQCIQYFRYFDRDCSGTLTADEFVHLHADLVRNGYGSHLSGDPQSDLASLDTGGDGTVNLYEYAEWLIKIGAISG